MKRLFVLLMGVSFTGFAVTPDPVALGAGSQPTTFNTTPMVPKYQKPALPPEETEAELAEEDPVKSAVKNTAVAGGILLGSNLLLKGFSNKYMKEACLVQNSYKDYSKQSETGVYYVWDSGFSFKKDETEKCLACCPEGKGKSTEQIEKESQQRDDDIKDCKEKYSGDDEKNQLEDCLKNVDKGRELNTCISDKKCEVDFFTQQMRQFCNKKKFKENPPCKTTD